MKEKVNFIVATKIMKIWAH